MRRNLRNALSVSVAILGLLVLAYPFLSSMAQKALNQESRAQENALQVVRQNVVANSFYDNLQAQEADWILTKASYYPGGLSVGKRDGQNVYLALKKDKAEIQVSITEYNSIEDAAFPFKMQISQGIIKDCESGECGDEGQKIYSPNGDFAYLRFRKGRFFVSIYCDSEEVAKRFAGYAISTIANS